MKETDWKIIELLVTFFGILAGAIVSLYVFKRGQLEETNTENERLNSLEKSAIGSIRDLKIHIEKQSQELLDAIRQLKNSEINNYSPIEIVSLHAKGITWINKDDLYKIFVLRKVGIEINKRTLFRQLNSHCEYINSILESWREIFSYYKGKYELYEKSWGDNYNLTIRFYDQLKAVIERDKVPYKLLDDIHTVYIKYIDENTDFQLPSVAKVKFIEPMQVICRLTEGDVNAVKFLHHSNDALHALDNLTALREFIIDSIEKLNMKMMRSGNELQSIADQYEKMPTVENENFLSYIRSNLVIMKNYVLAILFVLIAILFIIF